MAKEMEIGIDFFAGNTLEVAQNLLGKKIQYRNCAGIVVETEAYRDDPASHGARKFGKSVILRATYGRIYIYFVYGMHFCLNFTTERYGVGAVLIRAVEPVEGMDIMHKRRRTRNRFELTNGPGKICQAFGIDRNLFGEPVGGELKLFSARDSLRIGTGRRIGISKAQDLDWRFFILGNPYVSRR